MDPTSAASAATPAPPAEAPNHLRWEITGLQTYRCNIATAIVAPDEIILNFGGVLGRDHPGELGVTLLRRIALSPLTAKHLGATLQRLVAEFDSRQQRTG